MKEKYKGFKIQAKEKQVTFYKEYKIRAQRWNPTIPVPPWTVEYRKLQDDYYIMPEGIGRFDTHEEAFEICKQYLDALDSRRINRC